MIRKKIVLSLAVLIISVIYIIHPFIISKGACVDGFKDEIIRFHIRANSDREEDQNIKLNVRDAVLKETKDRFGNNKSIDETRIAVKNSLDDIKGLAEGVIKDEGKDLPVEVSLGLKEFPTRKYGDLVFPAGEYETLEIILGEGKGKNWWCVMFPPLCFVDSTQGDLTEEPPILKSKIAEVAKKTKTYIANFIAEN